MADSALKYDDVSGRLDPSRYMTKVNRVAAVVGLIFFSLAVFLAWRMFRIYVPPSHMQPWVWGSAAFLFSWLVIDIVLLLRHPNDPELLGVWERLANYVRAGSNVIVLSTVWVFLPFAPHMLQLSMTIFYVAHVATQILTMPGRGAVNVIGAAAVTGSVAICTLMNGGEYAIPIAIFVAFYGAAMVALGLVVSQLIGNVLEQRRISDITALRLEDALAEVAEERDAKTRFIAAASHDLGQPLQAASLFFDQTLRASDVDQRDRAADGVRKAFASADQLLSHMLNHLRLEADAVDPHFAHIAVGPTMARIAAQFGPAASAAEIDIRLVRSRARLRLDKVLFERALGNLVNNAIEHSGATRIVVAARRHGSNIRIWVIDDGCGIARVDADRIFDDYYRGSDSRAATKSGFGLGLSSVRRIAGLMDGTAGLDPRWLGGAAFFLEFPAPVRGKEQLP